MTGRCKTALLEMESDTPQPAHRAGALRRTLAGAAASVLVLLLCASASAAPPLLTWSSPAPTGASGAPTAVACSSASLCSAVDAAGEALTSADPSAASPSWSVQSIDQAGRPLTAISCAPGGPCVAVDAHGGAAVQAQAGSPWASAPIDGSSALTGVSCPDAALCVAVDSSGNVVTTSAPASGPWSTAPIDVGHALTGVSCSSAQLCVAVDDAGTVWWSTAPTAGAASWHAQRVAFAALTSVSCTAAGCLAVDDAGDALASSSPATPAATWQITPIDEGGLVALSCAASGLCVALDHGGGARGGEEPWSSPAWASSSADAFEVSAVSCQPAGFCIALDEARRSISARVPGPIAATLPPTEVTYSAATLAGAVDPQDAELSSCTMEYGTSLPSSQSAPCSTLIAAGGGDQQVTALVQGLSANTSYRYRVLASGPSGSAAGAEESFTTALSPLVEPPYPHPYITGTPAPGQRLTCHAGTPSGVTPSLRFAWLRDQVPIPAQGESTYLVRNQDGGHHMQCQVSATDAGGSATGRSGFVTVPQGGVPVSSGESEVGSAAASGWTLAVPVLCSPDAIGGCRIRLHLTAVETLQGRRVVAVGSRARGRSAAVARRTVTLAAAELHLPAGARVSARLTLGAPSRRLLARFRRITATLGASGTLIGLFEAELSSQTITLNAPTSRRGGHVAARR